MKKKLHIDEQMFRDAAYERLRKLRGTERAQRMSQDAVRQRSPDPHRRFLVVDFVRANSLHGRGIGWIDAHLLASCLVAAVPLWTADDRLAKLAHELGISYTPV